MESVLEANPFGFGRNKQSLSLYSCRTYFMLKLGLLSHLLPTVYLYMKINILIAK